MKVFSRQRLTPGMIGLVAAGMILISATAAHADIQVNNSSQCLYSENGVQRECTPEEKANVLAGVSSLLGSIDPNLMRSHPAVAPAQVPAISHFDLSAFLASYRF
jgi:hypothetical protein